MRVRRMLLVLAWALSTPFADAQSATGLTPEWDTRAVLQNLAEQAQKLKPLLEKVQPKEWLSRGASETYVTQWQKATNEIGYLVLSSRLLAEQPEKLTAAIDTLYRLDNLDILLHSLAGGIRKYQSSSLADQLQGGATANANNRERLRQYLLELATQKEQEYEAADKEVQRCRTELLRQPVRPAPRARNTEKR